MRVCGGLFGKMITGCAKVVRSAASIRPTCAKTRVSFGRSRRATCGRRASDVLVDPANRILSEAAACTQQPRFAYSTFVHVWHHRLGRDLVCSGYRCRELSVRACDSVFASVSESRISLKGCSAHHALFPRQHGGACEGIEPLVGFASGRMVGRQRVLPASRRCGAVCSCARRSSTGAAHVQGDILRPRPSCYQAVWHGCWTWRRPVVLLQPVCEVRYYARCALGR